jgi:hypothetical protein
LNLSRDDDLSKFLDELQASYPVLHQLIGDDYFTVMGCRFFQRHAFAQDSMACFDEPLIEFLKTEKPYSNVLSLADLVQFESAVRQSAVAGNVASMTSGYWQSLSKAAQDAMTLSLHPSLKIMKLDWNAPQIWESLSSGKEVPEPELKPAYWLVHKKGWCGATPLEIAALESVYHGLTVKELREELANLVEEGESAPLVTEKFLGTWLEQGLLSSAIKEESK